MGTARELISLNESTPQLEAPQTGDTVVCPITLQAATGNEIAYNLQFTVNKATSGNDTGLLINQTDTASPGTSLLADFQVGGTSQVSIDNVGKFVLDKAGTYGTTTGVAFGDGDTGFYESSDDNLILAIAGSGIWKFSSSFMGNTGANKPRLLSEVTTATNPNIAPDGVDTDTGIGAAADDQLSLIAGGVEGIRITEAGGITSVDINQGTNDAPFFDFQATADADATSAISTLTTSGGTTHHVQVEINGVTAWIAVSTTDPS